MTFNTYSNNPLAGKKAAIMSRVSSDEQAKKYSLGAQEESLVKYCNDNGIEIVHIIKEDHSAKDFNRPAFQKFLKEINSKQLAIDLLLFITWDRFSRNASESYEMIRMLTNKGIQAIAIDQPLDLNIPENKAMLAIYLALPEIENDRRSIRVKSGMYAAMKKGRWVNAAPLGYKNTRDERNQPIIEQNQLAIIILHAFRAAAKGTLQSEIITEIWKKFGVRIAKTKMSILLRHVVYTGYIQLPAYQNEPAHLVKGLHTPIIDVALFEKVQNILNDRVSKRGLAQPKSVREELVLRGILQCENCGEHVTGSKSRSKTGAEHYYYHCNHCKVTRYPAKKANDWMTDVIGQLKFNNNIDTLYRKVKEDIMDANEDIGTSISRSERIQEELKRLGAKKQGLQESLMSDKINIEQFGRMDNLLQDAISKLQGEMGSVNSVNLEREDRETRLKEAMTTALNLAHIYNASTVNERVKILSSTFPEKVIFSKIKSRTPKINSVIELMLLKDRDLEHKKTGQLLENLEVSRLVARTGIEPVSHP